MHQRDRVLSLTAILALLAGLFAVVPASAAERLKPFILVSDAPGDLAAVAGQTRSRLEAAGFEIVGGYSPYEGAELIVVSNGRLQEIAARTPMGGVGAVVRVGVTAHAGKIQVAYTNPPYWANAYRLESDLADVAAQLTRALGEGKPYGARGLTAKKLRKYHYKIMMPYFDDTYKLGDFPSHAAAVEQVEKGLAAKAGGVSRVYRLDIPGKEETVFGVKLTEGCSGDKYIMDRIDFGDIKSTPHLPYEMVVTGGKVRALHAKFRIAISFPDLSMVGKNSFFSIMCAPDAIEKALAAVAGRKGESEE